MIGHAPPTRYEIAGIAAEPPAPPRGTTRGWATASGCAKHGHHHDDDSLGVATESCARVRRHGIAPVVVASLLAVACSKKSHDGLPPRAGRVVGPARRRGPAQQPGPPPGAEPARRADDREPPVIARRATSCPPATRRCRSGARRRWCPDVTQMGFSSPDPIARSIRTSASGVIRSTPRPRRRQSRGAIFLIGRRRTRTAALGAAARLDGAYADGLRFELTEAHAMVAGTDSRRRRLTARYDQELGRDLEAAR